MKKRYDDQKLISTLLSGKAATKYQGKQVVVCGGHVYILPENDKKSGELVNKLIKQYPSFTPTVAFVPKHGTYILLIQK